MRIGIIQSCYLPWRGFFDFIASVDRFVLFDDVAYPVGRSWRNRNQVKTPRGLTWLTMPVRADSRHGPIDAAVVADDGKPWRDAHRGLLSEALAPALHWADALALWQNGVGGGDDRVSAINERLIRGICEYLGIATPIVRARDYAAVGAKTERLLDLCRKLDATTYLSGPTAQGYLEEEKFFTAGIGLEYKSYDYPPYPQLWGDFVGTVTVLDLIANCGPKAREFLSSRSPDTVALPPTKSTND